jgi:hypothetical protein
MLISLGSIFGSIGKSGLFGSLRASMNWEEKRYKGSYHCTDLSCINVYVHRDHIKKNFHVSAYARCSDLTRTGLSDSDTPRIYNATGFKTFDGAFGFLTEQVDQSQKEYKSTHFFFYPDPESKNYPDPESNSTHSKTARVYEYEGLTQQWKPFPIMVFKCKGCGAEVSGDELLGFTIDANIFCNKCSGNMFFDRYKAL